jgi:hypothetical protein
MSSARYLTTKRKMKRTCTVQKLLLFHVYVVTPTIYVFPSSFMTFLDILKTSYI